MKEDDYVHIMWLDSGLFHEKGWETKEEILPATKLATVNTVGILLNDDDECYRVALSADFQHGHYFGVQTIAKKNVLSVRVLNDE
jgi:hypothetical protein